MHLNRPAELEGTSSTGWATFLEGVLSSDLAGSYLANAD